MLPLRRGLASPSRIKRGAHVEIWHEDCAAKYVATVADPPQPPPSGRPLLSQERVAAAIGAGVEFHLEEPNGFTWIYAPGVNPADPDLKLAEQAIEADRAGVEEFLRWRQARGG